MKTLSLSIPDVQILIPDIHYDDRGFFLESFNLKQFKILVNKNINFVQDNHSCSKKGVVRGLHYQLPPFEQAKLIRVVSGKIFDVALDLRKNSKTYGCWVGEYISSDNKRMMWIPEGFAHGFIALEDNTHVIYKVNNYYSKVHERSIHYINNDFKITWPYDGDIIISSKDDNDHQNNLINKI